MKIFVHDFAGHPFQIQLSSELARRGHSVVHAYFADIPGPKGKFGSAVDLPNLRVEPIHVKRQFAAYSYFQRMITHREYAGILAEKIREFEPDVVLSGNTPTDAQYLLNRECKRQNIRFIHWMQDFYALALEALLSRKLGAGGGKLCAWPFHLLERRIFKTSDAVVYISDDFAAYAAKQNYSPQRSVVIENWASLEDLPVRPKDNAWARENGLHDKFVFLYSGTMGLKHNPLTLLQLARRFQPFDDVRIVLVSQGIGRDFLEDAKRKEQLDNLLLLDFQPYGLLPDVLASADVLLASVEPDAGSFCVPSKILSYMCSRRPILMSVSPQNLAARIVTKSDSGFVTAPGDDTDFCNKASELYENRKRWQELAQNARRYAENTFDIDQIGSIFEAVLRGEGEAMTAVSSPIPARSSS
jgi:glycosyltransferase involved in cell wall biosynthesis